MVDTAGIKTYRGPSYRHPLYYRPKAKPVEVSTEKQEAERKAYDERTAKVMRDLAPKWGIPAEDVEEWIADQYAYYARKDAERARAEQVRQIVDDEARIAVEGDTATDDAPFGEPEQLPGEKDIADLDPNRVLLANCIECRARIYEGDDHHVSEDDEFCCAACADEGARS